MPKEKKEATEETIEEAKEDDEGGIMDEVGAESEDELSEGFEMGDD